jgi:GDP-D-mannose dehydratase
MNKNTREILRIHNKVKEIIKIHKDHFRQNKCTQVAKDRVKLLTYGWKCKTRMSYIIRRMCCQYGY